ncbi:transcriptional repressor TraM [Brucella intermedia]|uniref:transcriptional repressor TraM n=1 Tax=Brucella intermedia TaxID=94625 RepID=UPI00224B759B|nr:transcriptional repressor TraM [Brucella intermedia]
MDDDHLPFDGEVKLRPVIGLTRGLGREDLESLAVDALIEHRKLAAKAEALFGDLPEEQRNGSSPGGPAYLGYVKAMIAMHAQMTALSSLLGVLGYVPTVPEH